jgi:hypothetical protein
VQPYALAQGAGAAAVHDPTLAWRALPMMLEALQSPIPALRAAAAEAICEPDFATAAAALLFRRHDVGMRRPRLFELRRVLDATWEDPVLMSAQELPDTGLAKNAQMDAAWRGEYLVPWNVILRGRARALFEMDLGGRVGTVHIVLQSKHVQWMTASMVHIINLTPGSDNPTRWGRRVARWRGRRSDA